MLMADTMAVFFVILGLALALVSLTLLVRGLWPRAVRISTERIERGLVVPLLVGLPIAFVPIFAAAVSAKLGGPIGTIAGAVILSITVFHAFIGIAGLATCIGQRLASSSDVHRPWRATMRGAVVIVLAGLLPIIGWFVLLPLVFALGTGAASIALARTAMAAVARPTLPEPTEAVFGPPEPARQ